MPIRHPPSISAAIRWPNHKAQFFLSDGTYLRYDMTADAMDAGYPKPIDDASWPGLGPYVDLLVAACTAKDPNKVYFFLSDGQYLRYDIAADCVDDGYPSPIDDTTWPGLGDHATEIFGALNWTGNKAYFFLNDGTYIRYDLKSDRADEGYPLVIDDETWPGLAAHAQKLTTMINWDNGKAYFFLNDNTYLRYDVASDSADEDYPKPVNDQTWPGLGPIFAASPKKLFKHPHRR
jgi:hypothetical protein